MRIQQMTCCAVLLCIGSFLARAQGVAEYQKQSEPTPSAAPQEQAAGKPAPAPTAGFDVPQPTIITQPNFKPRSSFGITTESDGTPFTDHKTYSVDTSFFIQKLKDGISKKGHDPDLDQLLKELEQASFDYNKAEGTIHYEEQTTLGNPVRLDDNPNPRGKELRDAMKQAITQMANIRAKITSLFAPTLEAGHLPQEQ